MDRRSFFPGAALAGPCAVVAAPVIAQRIPTVTVYKSATCGCCKDWVKHLE